MKDTFSTYHPFVNLIYFVIVIAISIFAMHPAFLAISFICSFTYSIKLNGIKAMKFNIMYMVPMMIIGAAVNPLFVHEGSTILIYFSNGNPLTLESIIYGISSSIMMVTVLMWFSCYNAVMTSDKFIYIFGRIIPSMSLILSMVLRFIPKYKAQIKVISNAQKCMGRDVTNGSIVKRAKNGLKILSIMLTWALENGIDTADSMKARGYGLKGRTSFSNFRFDNRDKFAVFIIAVFMTILSIGIYSGSTSIRFYPTVKIPEITIIDVIVYTVYGVLCMLPVVIDIKEDMNWKSIKYQN